ncbi:MAG: RC-LH1 core complex protein PufX [Gemmobacter sp.]
MSDRPDYIGESSRTAMLRGWVMMQMLRGAMGAAVAFFGVMILIWLIWLFGLILPPESKQAPPPMPQGALDQPYRHVG